MAISTVYKLDKIRLNTGSPVDIDVITSRNISAGITMMIERGAGHPHPTFTGVNSQKPVVEFTTPQIDKIVGSSGFNVPINGLVISAAPVYLYFKKAAVVGSVARATSEHIRLAVNLGCLYWTRINLPHQGRGEISCTLMASYDGSNEPIVYSGSQALVGNLSAGNYFQAGPCYLNGTLIDAVQDITINSGVRLLQLSGSGDIWDTFVGIEQTEGSYEVSTLEMNNWGSGIGLDGVALDGSYGFVAYGRKCSADGTRVANGTGAHLSFTSLYGHLRPNQTSGSGTTVLSDSFSVQPRVNSDSTVEITTAVNATIP